jgi:hypothetical protein
MVQRKDVVAITPSPKAEDVDGLVRWHIGHRVLAIGVGDAGALDVIPANRHIEIGEWFVGADVGHRARDGAGIRPGSRYQCASMDLFGETWGSLFVAWVTPTGSHSPGTEMQFPLGTRG